MKPTDTEMLDWLERTDQEPPYRLVDGGWWWCYRADPKRSLRAAIRAAMQGERREKKS